MFKKDPDIDEKLLSSLDKIIKNLKLSRHKL